MLKSFYSLARRLKYSNLFGLHNVLNLFYYDPRYVRVPIKKNRAYLTIDGCKFWVNDQIDSLHEIDNNAWYAGVTPEDTVLDIGANIGAVSIPLAKVAKRVFAVEPLFSQELKDNITLNDLQNIRVLECALGQSKGIAYIVFSSKSQFCPLMSWEELKQVTGKVDFLKVDAEGAEWLLHPEDMAGIRELRFEFHVRRECQVKDSLQLRSWLEWFESEKYEVVQSYGEEPGPCVPFSKCILVRASKKEV